MDETSRLERMVAAVQTLSATELEELFQILHVNHCEYSHNNNGIFINLRWLSEGLLAKIEQFIEFCSKSKRELEKYENLRKELQANFQAWRAAAADAREAPVRTPLSSGAGTGAPTAASRKLAWRNGSSANASTRFLLLKKKFAKPNAPGAAARGGESELKMERYAIASG